MTTTAPLPTTPNPTLDAALIDIADEFAGHRDTTALHREIVGTLHAGVLGVGGVLHAALYRASLDSSDELYQRLWDLHATQYDLDKSNEHDLFEYERCSNLRDEALTAIKTLLGPWVLADLQQVAA